MVGINAYEKLPRLKNAAADAKALEDELRNAGVKRITSATDCTYEKLTHNINEFLPTVHEGDVAIVYLAAHAAMYRNDHVFLTTTSTENNIADTSLRVQLLIARSFTCCIACTLHV